MILGVLVVAYFAFKPGVPFKSGYRVEATFKSSNGLRKGSPVRIAGVDSGKVVKIDKGEGATTVVTMKIKDEVRPLHRDATARIRPRVFLEGGFMVELSPGSPSAPELEDNDRLPPSQTAVPVQFQQVLTAFDSPTRESVRSTLDTLAAAFDNGGANGLKVLAPQLAPLSRDLAWNSEALRGTKPHDVSDLITATNKVAIALDKNPETLGALVDNLAVTARAVSSEDDNLARSIHLLAPTLQATPAAMRALNEALPAVERASAQVEPALPIAPGAFRETTSVLRRLGALVRTPAERAKTTAALETAFRDLPGLVGNLAATFPSAKPLSDCLASHVVPLFESQVPDGALSSGRPVWQDFAHSLVGLSSASQNFDGNGHWLRYQAGFGTGTVSLSTVPVLGSLLALAPPTLHSRPLPPADRKPPPVVGSQPCSQQPQPNLNTPSGGAGLQPASAKRSDRPRLTLPALKRLLAPANAKKLLEGVK
jgi:virulence factor Mce-like protein